MECAECTQRVCPKRGQCLELGVRVKASEPLCSRLADKRCFQNAALVFSALGLKATKLIRHYRGEHSVLVTATKISTNKSQYFCSALTPSLETGKTSETVGNKVEARYTIKGKENLHTIS